MLILAACGGKTETTTATSTETPTTTITTTTTTTKTTTTPTTTPIVRCIANFSAENIDKKLGKTTVQFSDLSIGDISGWAWDFSGDGTIDSTEQHPIYIYHIEGAYEVSLTVTGENCQDSTIRLFETTKGCCA
jgi:PKD repeat protein